jgi:hypothetical protein
MKRLLSGILVFLISLAAKAQYFQDFDTLITSGTGLYDKLPDGWGIYEVGSGAAADGKYAVANGSNTTGNTYSFGTTGATDRALGTLASNTNFPTLGAIFFNEVDSVITTITITYTGEQWRYGGRATPTKDTLRFEYSLDAQGIVNNVGTWIRVTALDFQSPYTTGTSAVVLDGNVSTNRQTIAYTITGLSLQPGQSIVLRWSDFNISGNDDGLAVDDFSISAGLAPGVLTSGGTTVGGGTGGGGGTTTTGTSTSMPIFEHKVATDSGFLHLYGNLHGHTTHSDGKPSTGEPRNAYDYARAAQGMDFLGVSEHNHSTAGLQIADYKQGAIQADTSNGKPNLSGDPFVALHGMEWGTISGGGHVLLYGFKDSLLNWETGNYDVYVPKSDYLTLFEKVRANPEAVALLAHPGSSDFTGLTGGYKGVADSAVASVAIESGPAFSTSTTYSDYPSSLAYINYYRSLLKQGYRVGAHMDQDNHELTFGTANANRIVVLSKDRTREGVLNGIRSMRVYASNDYNAQVSFTMGGFVLGSSIVSGTDVSGVITYTDSDSEPLSAVQVWGGRVRSADATLIHTATGNTSFTTAQANGETWYYYAVLTQVDGNKIVTAPIWVTKNSASLPVTWESIKASAQVGSTVLLNWKTAFEQNTSHFIVERSHDVLRFDSIGRVNAQGRSGAYSFIDRSPLAGMNFYRLRQVDRDGRASYSAIVSASISGKNKILVGPNPTSGPLTLYVPSGSSTQTLVQLIDMAGNRVYNKLHSGTQIQLNLSSLPVGTYVLRAGTDLFKITIQR